VNDFETCLSSLPRVEHYTSPFVSIYPMPSIYKCSLCCSQGRLRKVNLSIPPDNSPQSSCPRNIPDFLSLAVDDLIAHLNRSVMLRVQDIPRPQYACLLCTKYFIHVPFFTSNAPKEARVAVLFSGGIDSSILAFLAHRYVLPSEASTSYSFIKTCPTG
jgi:hypothetical protein